MDPQVLGLVFGEGAVLKFAVAAVSLAAGSLIVIRKRSSLLSTLFFLVALTVAAWLLGMSLMFYSVEYQEALWWTKAAYVGVPFIASALYHLTVVVLGISQRAKILVWLGWTCSLLFAVAILGTDALISNVFRVSRLAYRPAFGWLSIPYLTFFLGLVVTSFSHCWTAYRKAAPGTTHAQRLRLFILAFAVVHLGLSVYLTSAPLYPLGYLPIFSFLVMIACAIWQHRLVDFTPSLTAELIISTMADPLIVLDAEGVVRVANPAAGRLLAHRETELIGQPLAAIDHGFLTKKQLDALMQVDGIQRNEVICPAGDEGARILSTSAAVMRDHAKHPIGLVYVMRDVTESKRTEKALEEERQQLKTMNRFMMDREGRVLELKREVNALLKELNRKAIYDV